MDKGPFLLLFPLIVGGVDGGLPNTRLPSWFEYIHISHCGRLDTPPVSDRGGPPYREQQSEGNMSTPSTYQCRDCKHEYIDYTGDHCPECGGSDVIFLGDILEKSDNTEGKAVGWVELDEDQMVKMVVTDGEAKFNVAASKGPGTYALVRTDLD